MSKKQLYFVEIVDMFGGEANYSWVTRHAIYASSIRGAASKMSRLSGLNWRNDGIKYLSKSAAVCMFIEEFDNECHSEYRFNTDERADNA